LRVIDEFLGGGIWLDYTAPPRWIIEDKAGGGSCAGDWHTQIVKLGLELWILQGRYLSRKDGRGEL